MAESLQIRADHGHSSRGHTWDSTCLAERYRLDFAETLHHLA